MTNTPITPSNKDLDKGSSCSEPSMAFSEKKIRPLAVSSDLLLNLASELEEEWLDVGRYLHLSDPILCNIREDNAGNTKEAEYQMLMCWKEAKGQEATYSSLARALLQAGREDLSEKVKHEEDRINKRSMESDLFSEPGISTSKRPRTMYESSLPRLEVGDDDFTAFSNAKKIQFVKELRIKYRNLCGSIQPVPFLRDKYDIEELFVESGIRFLDSKQGLGKEAGKWSRLKSYKTVFTDPRVKSKRRIIDGEPGYGKSTLGLQITHDWCHGKSPMDGIEILILLRLRQFKNVPTVFSAIRKFLLPKDSKLTEDDIEDILDSSTTLILLDGYDEYPGRGKKDNDVENIMKEEMFQKHDVILTTRISCLPPNYSLGTKMIRLTGFDYVARDTYIRNVVAGGSFEEADKIKHFFRDNPVPEEFSMNPLFFAMIAFMVYLQERFFNSKSVTDFFRHISKCFYTHDLIKAAKSRQEKELDHSALEKITFEGLCGDSQQISWGKNELKSKIGKKLYNECLRLGLLIEEDVYDFSTMEYKTETSFYHMLFGEWFAAHYLVKEAARQGTEFENWLDSLLYDPYREVSMLERISSANVISADRKDTGAGEDSAATATAGTVASATRADTATSEDSSATAVTVASAETTVAAASVTTADDEEDKQLLNSLDPNYVHYMYRFACGLYDDAALIIIGLLAKEENYDTYTMLCITEWGGNLDKIKSTVDSLCSRGFSIEGNDSIFGQISSLKLIEFASDQKIPIDSLGLYNCLDVRSGGELRVKPFNLTLPVIHTNLKLLYVEEERRQITEDEIESILQYCKMCPGMETLQFFDCLLPRRIKITESVLILRSRDVKVDWIPYRLNLESGQWEHYYSDGSPLTDADYQEEMAPKQWVEWKKGLSMLAEKMKQCELEDETAPSNG